MRIAFLCKRQYMNKDVILDRYARLYEIPRQLAKLGHEVNAYCLSYQKHDEGSWEHEAAPGKLRWESLTLHALVLPTLLGYPYKLLKQLAESAPDVIIAASDIPHVVMGAWLSRRLGVPFVADLYDNFEGFGQARLPGMVQLLRKAVREANLVLTTSESLRRLVIDSYRSKGKVVAMPSTIDKSLFHPRDKRACRDALGLPADARLIGTAGGLYHDKGINTLYDAWNTLAAAHPDLYLVLAGPVEKGTPHPSGERVYYLGAQPHEQIARLFCALDVGVMCIRDTPFGRYCFPQKAYEMLACGLPVVAADIGAMGDLLAQSPQSLYQPEDAASLAEKIRLQLQAPAGVCVEINDWAAVVAEVEPLIRQIAAYGVVKH